MQIISDTANVSSSAFFLLPLLQSSAKYLMEPQISRGWWLSGVQMTRTENGNGELISQLTSILTNLLQKSLSVVVVCLILFSQSIPEGGSIKRRHLVSKFTWRGNWRKRKFWGRNKEEQFEFQMQKKLKKDQSYFKFKRSSDRGSSIWSHPHLGN